MKICLTIAKKHEICIDMQHSCINASFQFLILVDFTAPGNESERRFMMKHARVRPGKRIPQAPQLFNDENYCGDYQDFDIANEDGFLGSMLD